MKQLPVDVSFFKTLITENYLYIDKTEQIYNLIKKGRYYFLSRPRRFGKSLLISTFEEIFAGNRDLFKGLWIDSSDYSWPKHPVISLDFSSLNIDSSESLKEDLAHLLDEKASEYEIDLSNVSSLESKLRRFVAELSKLNNVVVLIDEYDSPLVKKLTNLPAAQANLDVLNNFFGVIKSLQRHIRAIFITGVSKFSKANVFSGLNNLNDISLDPIAASLLGYTEQEIDAYFPPYIEQLALKKKIPIEKVRTEMRLWYNGYRFTEKPEKVYNPFSVHFLFEKNAFKNYWFESATPSFLVKELAKKNYTLKDVEQTKLSSRALGSIALDKLPLTNLLFQAGYLTISDYDEKTENYTLNFPNSEVKESFMFYLFSAFSRMDLGSAEELISTANDALQNYDMKSFCTLLDGMFARVPYLLHDDTEGYFHSVLQLLTTLLGLKSQSEVTTNKGIIDLVIETDNYVYIFELKRNSTPEKALKQIEERKYYERYLISNKKIILVGMAFNQKVEKLTLNCVHKAL